MVNERLADDLSRSHTLILAHMAWNFKRNMAWNFKRKLALGQIPKQNVVNLSASGHLS